MMRGGYILTAGIALLAIAGAARPDITPRLIWNVSASVPPGFYLLHPGAQPALGDLVVVAPPEPLAGFLAERGYLGPGVLLLKHVAALPGQAICRSGSIVAVDGREIAEARARDRMGRELPVWQGCRILERGEIFLLNRNVPDSLDGRYFGPLPTRSVRGRAIPIWTTDDGTDHPSARAVPISAPHDLPPLPHPLPTSERTKTCPRSAHSPARKPAISAASRR